jgi:hypothetical protein
MKSKELSAQIEQNVRSIFSDFLTSSSRTAKLKVYCLIDAIYQRAIDGDVRAAELLLKYAYGTPNPMPIENTNAARPINVTMVLTSEQE